MAWGPGTNDTATDVPPEFQAKVSEALPGILTTGGAHAQEQVLR